MTTYPREPNPGETISAQLLREIIRTLRRITPIAGPGVKTRTTPNGTAISAEPGSDAKAAATVPSCFDIATETQGGELVTCVTRRYFTVGGKTREMPYAECCKIDQWVMQEDEEDDKPYIALVVKADTLDDEAEIVGEADFNDLAVNHAGAETYVRPLYKLSHSGSILIDYRNIPVIQMFES